MVATARDQNQLSAPGGSVWRMVVIALHGPRLMAFDTEYRNFPAKVSGTPLTPKLAMIQEPLFPLGRQIYSSIHWPRV